MNLKKIVAGIVLMSGLVTSAGAFADATVTQSGVVNVDLMRPQLQMESRSMTLGSASRKPAGGGDFWVEWGQKNGSEAYRSFFEHNSKTHKTSVVNRYHSDSSGWVSAGTLAKTDFIYAALNGNKAYWDTK